MRSAPPPPRQAPPPPPQPLEPRVAAHSDVHICTSPYTQPRVHRLSLRAGPACSPTAPDGPYMFPDSPGRALRVPRQPPPCSIAKCTLHPLPAAAPWALGPRLLWRRLLLAWYTRRSASPAAHRAPRHAHRAQSERRFPPTSRPWRKAPCVYANWPGLLLHFLTSLASVINLESIDSSATSCETHSGPDSAASQAPTQKGMRTRNMPRPKFGKVGSFFLLSLGFFFALC